MFETLDVGRLIFEFLTIFQLPLTFSDRCIVSRQRSPVRLVTSTQKTLKRPEEQIFRKHGKHVCNCGTAASGVGAGGAEYNGFVVLFAKAIRNPR